MTFLDLCMEPDGAYGGEVVKPYVLWPALAGTLFLIAGLAGARRAWTAARGLEKLVALGPVFVAAPLAAFGAEHLVLAPSISQMIPSWIPLHLFWAYFVGLCLFAAAGSLDLRKQLRLSATLLGTMFVLFVLLMHVPNAVAHPGDRFVWAVALRDLAFGGGALAFAGSLSGDGSTSAARWLVGLGRLLVGVPLLLFAAAHFVYPGFAPGVPLKKVTPAWIPAPPLWGYATGAVLLGAAVALLTQRRARQAASWLGLWLVLLSGLLYVPIMAAAGQASELLEGLNYVWDTLLFAGTALLVAAAMPARRGREAGR
jgi:hypothetical protein